MSNDPLPTPATEAPKEAEEPAQPHKAPNAKDPALRAPGPKRQPYKSKKQKRGAQGIEDTHLRGVMHSAKKNKKNQGPWIRATVFPREGGAPYTEDVDVDEGGTFTLKDSSLSYHIARGSVWQEDDVYRCLVNEANGMTIHAHTLTGDDAVSPEAINGVAWNNLWWQYDDETRPKSAWPMRGAIGLGIFALLLVGGMVWMIISLGGDLESIRNAIEGLQVGQGSSGASPGEGVHNNIAPGGN